MLLDYQRIHPKPLDKLRTSVQLDHRISLRRLTHNFISLFPHFRHSLGLLCLLREILQSDSSVLICMHRRSHHLQRQWFVTMFIFSGIDIQLPGLLSLPQFRVLLGFIDENVPHCTILHDAWLRSLPCDDFGLCKLNDRSFFKLIPQEINQFHPCI